MNLDKVLTGRRQWIVWKWEGRDNRKVPVHPASLKFINAQEPLQWMTFEHAQSWIKHWKPQHIELNLGFVLSQDDPIVCIDLDGCRNPESGDLAEWAVSLIGDFDSYTEISPSGTGVKIFIKCDEKLSLRFSMKLRDEPVISSKQPGLEIFSERQFVAITGNPAYWIDSIEARPKPLQLLLQRLRSETNAILPAGSFQDNPEASEATVNAAKQFISGMPEAISGARGHDATFAVACRLMIDFALSFDQAMELFREYNDRCCPPWDSHDLRHKLQDAGKKTGPRGWRSPEAIVTEFMEAFDMEAVQQCVTAVPATGWNSEVIEAFPTHILPDVLRNFVLTVAASVGCDESFVALPVLAACAGAIGNSRSLLVKAGWVVPSIVWCVLIGESGTQKSPAFNHALKPLKGRQKEWSVEYQEKRIEFKTAEAAQKKKNSPGSGVRSVSDGELNPPVSRRCLVSDATIESLVEILHDNPKGVLLARDELVGWIGSFDKYSSKGTASADVAHWLSIYSGQSIVVDRKTGDRRSLFVSHPAVSVCGGIQPEILKKAIGQEHRENGLLARLLLTFPPRRKKKWSDKSISPAVEREYSSLINALIDMSPLSTEEALTGPELVRPSPEALEIFIEYVNSTGADQLDLTGDLAAAWSKLEETAARLALVSHCVRHVSGETNEAFVCDHISMQTGVSLATWFKNETKRIYNQMSESPEVARQRQLYAWIVKRGNKVRPRDLVSNLRYVPDVKTAELLLEALVQRGLGRWEQSDNLTGPSAREFALLQ